MANAWGSLLPRLKFSMVPEIVHLLNAYPRAKSLDRLYVLTSSTPSTLCILCNSVFFVTEFWLWPTLEKSGHSRFNILAVLPCFNHGHKWNISISVMLSVKKVELWLDFFPLCTSENFPVRALKREYRGWSHLSCWPWFHLQNPIWSSKHH